MATIRSSKADLRQFLITALEEKPKKHKRRKRSCRRRERNRGRSREKEVEEVEAANVVKTLLGGMKKSQLAAQEVYKKNK